MSYDFQTITHAKWILTGEHAVVRGHGAIVFPLTQKTLTLSYKKTDTLLSVKFDGYHTEELEFIFLKVIDKGMNIINQSINDFTGSFYIQNDIPLGKGLGGSAALSAAIGRWFIYKKLLPAEKLLQFAQELENLFHGKSSGIDIIGATCDSGMYFKKSTTTKIEQTWQPQLYLSACNQTGITAHCIKKVSQLWEQDSDTAAEIDNKMQESVDIALKALTSLYYGKDNLKLLADAINLGKECFYRWGLINEDLNNHINLLLSHGAIAAKPTGSGQGGYVISLWEMPPSTEFTQNIPGGLIKL